MYPTNADRKKHQSDLRARLVRQPMTEAQRLGAIEQMVIASGVMPEQREWLREQLCELSSYFVAERDPAPMPAPAPPGYPTCNAYRRATPRRRCSCGWPVENTLGHDHSALE